MVLNTPTGVQDMPALRKFHSIAALCGDGLRPELQALFERLAVDPHTELFARGDGMVQSGPDPMSAEGSLRQANDEIGDRARAAGLTARRRKEIAKLAAAKRWQG
jgi:hypothetical protein